MAFNYKTEYEKYRRYYQSLTPNLEKPENRAYTAIIFSFLVVSLFGWYAIRPTMQTIFTLKREIADKTELNKQMEDKISALIEAQAGFQSVESQIAIVNQALPTIPDPVNIVGQIRRLAATTGVTISSISVPQLPLADEGDQKIAPSKLAEYTLGCAVSGSYANIEAFISGIRNMRRIVQIDTLSFSPTAQRASVATTSGEISPLGSTVQMDMKLKVFYLSR